MPRRRFRPAALVAALAVAPAARADGPMSFTTVKLSGAAGSTEPRITVAPDGTRYLDTNDTSGNEVVYRSVDEGNSWVKTPGSPPQASATIDVDVIAMPTGRILASELDTAGLNFPTGTSDDGGKTWTESIGPRLADQDRQWFASGQPLEFNIVNATRVWVATSPDGTPGSWKDYLAVDDAASGQVVSMQLAYGALDNHGGVYVAYPESPKPYPDIGGAAIKLVYQKQDPAGDLPGQWSKPITLVPPRPDGSLGTTLVHLAVGDPGKIAVAYFRAAAVPGAPKPVWYTHVLHSLNVLDADPTLADP